MKSEAEKLFLNHKKMLIKQYGKGALYDDQIKKIIPWVNGVYAQDEAVIKPGYYVINTDNSNGEGEHWIGAYITKKSCYLYDSFSRTPKYLVPSFLEKLNKRGIKVYQSDKKDKEQYGNSEVCGVLVCSWLMVVKELGIRKAMTI